MALGFTIKSKDCPAGIYKAAFVGAERTTHAEFGDGLKFTWEVVEGPHKGMQAFRYTSADPTPRNAAGRLMADLANVTAANGVSIDLDACVGKHYMIVVREGESGRTRVESASLVTEAEEAPF
jgi:hypothetical protein